MLLTLAVASAQGPTVEIADGPLLGGLRTSVDGASYMSFEGIPFAAPPIGSLRFAPPRPVKPWSEPLDVSGAAEIKCIQFGYMSDGGAQTISGSEDCLYLNVWAPMKKKKEPSPVVMWIYGGSLTAGSNRYIEYGPSRFIDHDVIIVSPNYRLGPFGFTSLGIEEAPGNQGFLDLIAALLWIQDNIEHFGGDPKSVTIAGESSGSWAASYLALTPLAKGLFQRAILQSGSLFNPYWTWQTQHDAVRLNDYLATAMNCSLVSESPHAALECLQNVSIEALEDSINWGAPETFSIQKIFRPTGTIDGKFLPENPVSMMAKGDYNHVDLMVGINKDEGLLQTYQMELYPELYVAAALGWKDLFGPVFLLGKSGDAFITAEDKATVAELSRYYIGDNYLENFNVNNFKNITDMMSDAYIWYGGHKQAEWAAAQGDNVYQYMFSFKGTFGFADAFGLDNSKYGVCHADELYYFWQPYWNKPVIPLTEREEVLSSRLLQAWANFARYGDPTVPGEDIYWGPVTPDSHNYINIDDEWTMQLTSEYTARMSVWDEHYRYPEGDTIPPIPPTIHLETYSPFQVHPHY